MISMINLAESLIMRLCISFSIFDLFLLQHDEHDTLPTTRAHTRTCAGAGALAGAHALSCKISMSIMLIDRVVRNLLTNYPFQSVKMSLCLFSLAWSENLVALLTS